jgi:hypothetical protein
MSIEPHLAAWARRLSELLRNEDGFRMSGWSMLGLVPADSLNWRFRTPWFNKLNELPNSSGTGWRFNV